MTPTIEQAIYSLRSTADDCGGDRGALLRACASTLADEVERLCAELSEVLRLARDDLDLRAKQRDERDRLREETERLVSIAQQAHDRLLRGDSDTELLTLLAEAWQAKSREQEAGRPLGIPRVLVTVNGGVAEYVCDDGVEVIVFDHDNHKADGSGTEPVPSHFADLAVPIGVPIADERSEPFNLVLEIVGRLAKGEEVVKRIVTMRYFTYEIDGEDLVVTDEKRTAIEQMAGAPLIEYTPAQYPGERGLGFDKRLLPEIQQRLSAASRNRG